MSGQINIYQVTVCYGQFVYCATSWKQLYSFLQNDERMRHEVLGVWHDKNGNLLSECRIVGFHEFMSEVANKFITETPLHLGYLGGHQE